MPVENAIKIGSMTVGYSKQQLVVSVGLQKTFENTRRTGIHGHHSDDTAGGSLLRTNSGVRTECIAQPVHKHKAPVIAKRLFKEEQESFEVSLFFRFPSFASSTVKEKTLEFEGRFY